MPYPITMQQGNLRVTLTPREASELKAMQETRDKAQADFQRRSDFLFRRACQRAGIATGDENIANLSLPREQDIVPAER